MRKAGWIFILLVIGGLAAYAFIKPVNAALNAFVGERVLPAFGTTASNIVNSPFWQTYIKPNAVFFGIFYGIVIVFISYKLFGSIRERLPGGKTPSAGPTPIERPSSVGLPSSYVGKSVASPSTPTEVSVPEVSEEE